MTLNRRIVNNIIVAISAVSLVSCLIFFILSALFGSSLITAFFFLYSAIYGGVFLFSRLGFERTTAMALFIAIDTGILALSSMIGPEARFDIMFLLLMAFPFLLFERSQLTFRVLTATIPFISFLAINMADHNLLPRQALNAQFLALLSYALNASAFISAGFLFYYFSVNRDERLKLDQQMNLQVKRYERLDKAWKESSRLSDEKSRFIMTIGHEFRTPVTGIIGNLELIADNNIDQTELPRWEQLKRSAYNLNELLIDVLDFTQLEQGQIEIKMEPCEIRLLIERICHRYMPAAHEKHISINFDIADEVPKQLAFDRAKVERILSHLMSNAVKFTNDARGEISVRVELNRLEQVQILVRDTGIGIEPNKLQTIFNSFTQVDSELNRQYGGNGLGLYLSWHLAKALGGQLKVSSELGMGSNFIFTFNVEKSSAELMPKKPEPQSKEQLAQKHFDALIVEDNSVNQKVLKGMLQKLGISSEIAEDGQQALDVLAEKEFDIVFMDLQMPIMDGLEACRRFREYELQLKRKHPTPVLTISANATEYDRNAAMAAGMDGFLAKPFRLQQLSEKISEVTQRH